MAQPKIFRFHLRYYDGANYQYYYVSGGVVSTTTTQTALQYSPNGWRDCEIGWERGWTYYGLFTNYTTPLKFVKDGAQILRHLMYTTGIESKVELFVEKFNPASGTYAYATFVTGDLDMSQAIDEFDYVTANIMEGGFTARFKANELTPYEYDIDGNPDVQYVYHDGIDLQARLVWFGLASIMDAGINGNRYPPITYYDTEGTNLKLLFYDQDGTSNLIVGNNSGSIVDVTMDITYNITVSVSLLVGYNNYLQFEYREVNLSTGAFTGTNYFIDNSTYVHAPAVTHIYSGSDNQVITLADGFGLAVTVRMKDVSSPTYLSTLDYTASTNGMDVTATITNRYDPTYVPCLYALDVLNYLIASIGSANDGTPDSSLFVASTLLDTTYLNELVITSGDGLRNLTNSKLKITFEQFYKWLDSKFGVCFYYDSVSSTWYLDKKENVFSNSVSTTYPLISSCAKMRVTPFVLETFNNLKIGSGTFTYDQKGDGVSEITNGKDEFNNTTEWNTPIVRVKRTADYVSPIRCDMYGIEFQRINLTNKTISDSSSDNDIFAMHVDASNAATYYNPVTATTINYHILHREPIVVGTWEIENIFAIESAYNILFSPKRSMVRNGPYFRSLLKFNDSDTINFQVSGKNSIFTNKMKTLTGGIVDYDEGASIIVSDLCDNGLVHFQPVVLEFETLENINLYTLIGSDKYRYIEVVHLGNSYYGYLISVSTKPANRGITKFKLLATAGTDLTQLER